MCDSYDFFGQLYDRLVTITSSLIPRSLICTLHGKSTKSADSQSSTPNALDIRPPIRSAEKGLKSYRVRPALDDFLWMAERLKLNT